MGPQWAPAAEGTISRWLDERQIPTAPWTQWVVRLVVSYKKGTPKCIGYGKSKKIMFKQDDFGGTPP